MPTENWKLLIKCLEKHQDTNLYEKPRLYNRTLSIFFDPAVVTRSDYRTIERNGKRCLRITIYAKYFNFIPEVYWLPEAGLPIEVKIANQNIESFGFCGANKLYPVNEARLMYWSSEYSAKTFYPTDTLEHQVGNQAVRRVMLAFEKLENVTTQGRD
ncbi:hypothetical protein NIES4071_64280 [Calothrix sp. NIES-4071]|nr:hypothetical protein NIES4071_64280 [Calothrix sp. NIES-4071]BAZ60732.1 hypothetical protein NIES4105_64240 [Calothrix sp. NIES-4105]